MRGSWCYQCHLPRALGSLEYANHISLLSCASKHSHKSTRVPIPLRSLYLSSGLIPSTLLCHLLNVIMCGHSSFSTRIIFPGLPDPLPNTNHYHCHCTKLGELHSFCSIKFAIQYKCIIHRFYNTEESRNIAYLQSSMSEMP